MTRTIFVKWILTISLDIKNWPDWSQTYEIDVLPTPGVLHQTL